MSRVHLKNKTQNRPNRTGRAPAQPHRTGPTEHRPARCERRLLGVHLALSEEVGGGREPRLHGERQGWRAARSGEGARRKGSVSGGELPKSREKSFLGGAPEICGGSKRPARHPSVDQCKSPKHGAPEKGGVLGIKDYLC